MPKKFQQGKRFFIQTLVNLSIYVNTMSVHQPNNTLHTRRDKRLVVQQSTRLTFRILNLRATTNVISCSRTDVDCSINELFVLRDIIRRVCVSLPCGVLTLQPKNRFGLMQQQEELDDWRANNKSKFSLVYYRKSQMYTVSLKKITLHLKYEPK